MPVRITRPGGWSRRFFSDTTPYDLVIAAAGVVGPGLTAAKLFEDHHPFAGTVLVAAAVMVAGLTATKLVVTYLSREAARSPHLLESSLHALYEVLLLLQESEPGRDHGLRITVHVPVDFGKWYLQVVDYVGDQRDGRRTAGRRFSAVVGMIGRVLREREPLACQRRNENYTAYVDEMTRDWGYSKAEAEGLHPGTMSWMAIPLSAAADDSADVMAIVYADSTDPDFFTDLRQSFAIAACVGIARYVNKAYTS